MTRSWGQLVRLLCWLLAAMPVCVLAQPPGSGPLAGKEILLLHSHGEGYGGYDAYFAGFLKTIVAAGGRIDDIHIEKLELARNTSADYRKALKEFLRAKYGQSKIDLIVAVQLPALEFLERDCADLFGGTPYLVSAVQDETIESNHLRAPYLLRYHVDFDGTIRQALSIFPQTQRIVLTGGVGETDRVFNAQARRTLALWQNHVELEFLDDGNYEGMLARLRQLPPHTLVLASTFYLDNRGQPHTNGDVLHSIVEAAPAPVFTQWDTVFSLGVVGGSVSSFNGMGVQAAQAVLDYSSGRRTLEEISAAPAPGGIPTYDWPSIRQWRGEVGDLPANTVFLNRPPNLWRQHRDLVEAYLFIVLLLLTLIAAGFYQNRHRRKAERAARDGEERLRLLVEASPLPMLITDATSAAEVKLMNRSFTELFGYTIQEASSATAWWPIAYPDPLYRRAVQEAWAAAIAEMEARGGQCIHPVEVRITCRDGSERNVEVHMAMQRGVNLIIFNDLTGIRKAQADLEESNRELETRVRERTRELEAVNASLLAAVDAAEAANRAKSLFLSNMSHELRTPLTSIIGYSRLMASSPRLEREDRNRLETINRAGNHLLSLINDVLELSRIEAGRSQLVEENVPLQDLLEEVSEMLRLRAVQTGLALELITRGLPEVVRVDGGKLRQILLNLLGNAVKFTRQGGITLIVEGTQIGERRTRLDFTVADTGPGIAAEDQRRIFEPFVQLVTHATSAGTGLGLTITRRHIQMLGGDLSLESEPGKGSTFRFSLELPLVDGGSLPTREAGEVIAVAEEDRGRRILAVDDNQDTLTLLDGILTPLGFELEMAKDGVEALEKAESFLPDLILLDWRMPRLDGLATVRRIRAQSDRHQPHILIFSASALEEERNEALKEMIDGFLRKPLQWEEFFAALESVLQIRLIRRTTESASASAPEAVLTSEEIGLLSPAERGALCDALEEMQAASIERQLKAIAVEHKELAEKLGGFVRRNHHLELWKLLRSK
jgi:PAS domain S-box-containing protein